MYQSAVQIQKIVLVCTSRLALQYQLVAAAPWLVTKVVLVPLLCV